MTPSAVATVKVEFMVLMALVFSSPAFGNEECKVVNGFNLCQDAKKIAANTRKDIGVRPQGSGYILHSVHATEMRVISIHESIYSEEDIENLLRATAESSAEREQLKKSIMNQATNRLCESYSVDEFVNDGGSFEVNYKYRDGEIFHTVLAERGFCREIKPTFQPSSPTP